MVIPLIGKHHYMFVYVCVGGQVHLRDICTPLLLFTSLTDVCPPSALSVKAFKVSEDTTLA